MDQGIQNFDYNSPELFLGQFQAWFYQDKQIYAKRLLDRFEAHNEKHEENMKIISQSLEIQELQSDFEIYQKSIILIQKVINDDVGDWKKFMNKDTIKLFYKQEDKKSLYTFYMEKSINAPLFNVISVLAEA